MLNKTNMNVLLSSTSFPRSETDWQGIFIKHIVHALDQDPTISLSLWAPHGPIPRSVMYACSAPESAFLAHLAKMGGVAHLLRNRKLKSGFFIACLLKHLYTAYRRDQQFHIIHVNWLQNAIPLYGIQKPKLVTVLGSDYGLMKLPGMIAILRSVFKQSPTIVAPNAVWMIPELTRNFGDIASIKQVNFGIDPGWYYINRFQPCENIWLVVLRLTKKKIGPLFDWGEAIFANSEKQLHLFGPLQESVEIPSWAHYHGTATPDELLKEWFPRACGLISLSQHDEGLPQVMLEAMAASIPVVASSINAHEDLIREGESGFLVKNQSSFSTAIQKMSDSDLNRRMGSKARQYVSKHYGTWQHCAMRYIDCYHQLLNE